MSQNWRYIFSVKSNWMFHIFMKNSVRPKKPRWVLLYIGKWEIDFTILWKIFHELKTAYVSQYLVVHCIKHNVEKWYIYCHTILFFSSNQFRKKLFSEILVVRNFCAKIVAVKFSNFHNVLKIQLTLNFGNFD